MSGLILMAYALGIGFCIVAFGITRHRHHKTPTSMRPGSANPRAEVGTNCDGCDLVAPVVKYRGRNYCDGCATEVAALDQAAVDKEIRAMGRRWGA